MVMRIADWCESFEAFRGARAKRSLPFVTFPVRSISTGTRKLSTMEGDDRGAALLGCWICLVLAAGDLDEAMRGLLVKRDGTPYDAESLYHRFGLCSRDTWAEALTFFASPEIGWLQPVAESTPPRVVAAAAPLPKIEEPNIYEAAAERMIARYVRADAPIDRIPETVAVKNAIWRKVSERTGDPEELIELMEENQQLYIDSQEAKLLKTLDAWITGGLSLATRKGPKRYERGSIEALIVSEVRAGRMTPDEARRQGVEL